MAEPDPVDTPNCPLCLHPMEPVDTYGGVVLWSCGYGCDDHT